MSTDPPSTHAPRPPAEGRPSARGARGQSTPQVITGIAAMITAIGGTVGVLYQVGVIGHHPTTAPGATPPASGATPSPSPSASPSGSPSPDASSTPSPSASPSPTPTPYSTPVATPSYGIRLP